MQRVMLLNMKRLFGTNILTLLPDRRVISWYRSYETDEIKNAIFGTVLTLVVVR
jgi:hypothetical protein